MVKKKIGNILSKLLHFVNSIFAVALLLAYVLPLISPKQIPVFGVLSLLVPFLIIANVFFCIYWLFKLNKKFILSAVVLVVGWAFSTPFYRVSSKKIIVEKDVSVMSYNVRLFNHFKHIAQKNIDQKIVDFIHEKKPDVLAIQEFYKPFQSKLKYPYSCFSAKSKNKQYGLAIFSNYKIINSGSLDFKNSDNNIIFTDIVKDKDTIRVYNVHLQSLKINLDKENFGQKNSEKLIERLKVGFVKQALQTEEFLAHEKQFKGKKVICGDFNNTAYSWVYKQITTGKKDAFLEAGSGFGKSFNYFFPMRIDFIVTDAQTKINYYKTYNVNYSDHYPIVARLEWNN